MPAILAESDAFTIRAGCDKRIARPRNLRQRPGIAHDERAARGHGFGHDKSEGLVPHRGEDGEINRLEELGALHPPLSDGRRAQRSDSRVNARGVGLAHEP